MTKEKRPQDWTAEERLNVLIACGSLADNAINQLYREKAYTHITSTNEKMISSKVIQRPINQKNKVMTSSLKRNKGFTKRVKS